jgi:membrane fusion protein, multidrug efflux system
MRFGATAVVAVAAIAAGLYGWHTLARPKEEASAPPPVPVTTVAASSGSVPRYLRGIGTVRALNQVEIHPQVSGVLVSVPVREGQDVKKGDIIAQIDPRPYQAALDKAQAQLKQDQAQLQNAQADLGRTTALARSDFASRQQLETQTATVARLEGVLAADAAEIEQARINLSYCTLKAPLDGRIGFRRIDPGNLVQANGTGAGLVTIVQETPISVIVTLPENDLPTIRAAAAKGPVPVIADTSDMRTKLAEGQLLTTDNVIDASAGSIGLKAEFPNGDRSLTPGQFVSARVQVGTETGVIIPHEAVQHGQDKLFVYTAKPDKTVERHDVVIAYDDGAQTVLTSGVADGAAVIVSGISRIGPGTRIDPHERQGTETAAR